MPRSRGSDSSTAPPHHRASPRAPLHLRSTSNNTPSSADSNGSSVLHHNGRPIRDRSPKLEEHRRSPRSPLPEVGVCTTGQKKRATRVADLETRLGHAQEELRKLREQLASAEAAKNDAQLELQETKKKKKGTAATTAGTTASTNKDNGDLNQSSYQLASAENGDKPEDGQDKEQKQHDQHDEEGDKEKPKVDAAEAELRGEEPTAPLLVEGGSDDAKPEAVKEPCHDTLATDVTADGIPNEEKQNITVEQQQEEKELDGGCGDDTEVEKQIEEQSATTGEVEEQKMAASATATTTINNTAATTELEEVVVKPTSPDATNKPAAVAEEEMLELETRLWKKDKELDLLRCENASLRSQVAESAAEASALTEKVASLESSLDEQRRAAEVRVGEMEASRAALEAEVKRLRVQTEQWRKAADAAAAIISGEELNGAGALGGRKVAERCGSMDKYIGGGGVGFDAAAVLGSPLLEAEGDSAASGKRRGIRVFGDLWRKKGQGGHK